MGIRVLKPTAWLNLRGGCALSPKIGLKSSKEIITFLDAWQADYHRRHPLIRLTNVQDEFFGFICPGGVGPYVTGRRSFTPILNGRIITQRAPLEAMSEDYEAYITPEIVAGMIESHLHIFIYGQRRQ